MRRRTGIWSYWIIKEARIGVGCFAPLKMRPVRQEAVHSLRSRLFRAIENASRTVGGRFWYRISLPYRKSLFFTPNASEDASRTRGGCFAHRMSTPYRRRAFPVPSPQRQAAAAAELRTYKARGRPLVDLLLYYTVMSHVFGMLRKR